jgi:hypothetical protein
VRVRKGKNCDKKKRLGDGARRVVGEEGHTSDRPHRIGRTERAPSAGLPGCVCACVAAGLNLELGLGEKNSQRQGVLQLAVIDAIE